MDSTDTNGVLDGSDSDVTLLTPLSGPGVSDDVVVTDGLIGSPSDGSDGVIELGSTLSRVDDTTGVVVEDFLVGLDGNGDDTLLDGTLEANSRSLRNGSIVLDGNVTGGQSRVADASVAGSRGVGIFVLLSLAILLEVFEGSILPATVATLAGAVAGNEFLLGEAQEITGGSEVSVLNGSGGRESPA